MIADVWTIIWQVWLVVGGTIGATFLLFTWIAHLAGDDQAARNFARIFWVFALAPITVPALTIWAIWTTLHNTYRLAFPKEPK